MSDDQKRKKDMGHPGNGGEYTFHERDADTVTPVISDNVQSIIDALPEGHQWRSDPNRVAVVALSVSGALADEDIRSDLEEFRSIQAVLDRHQERHGVDLASLVKRINTVAQLAEKRGVDVVTYDDPDYPEQLEELGDEQPLALWTMGNRALLARGAENMIAVVGDIEPSPYGQAMARTAAFTAHESGSLVVSDAHNGTAYDVHTTVLAAKGAPVSVVAGGPDIMLKSSHYTGRRISTDGVVVSAQPVATEAEPVDHDRARRMMAALVGTVVVTEANVDSGALTVARTAHKLNDKRVYAYPGPVGAPSSLGSNTLIAEGTAELVLDPRNIFGLD